MSPESEGSVKPVLGDRWFLAVCSGKPRAVQRGMRNENRAANAPCTAADKSYQIKCILRQTAVWDVLRIGLAQRDVWLTMKSHRMHVEGIEEETASLQTLQRREHKTV